MSYKPKSWNAICHTCGFQFKSDDLKERWDGVHVCQRDDEQRHPSDFYRARGDRRTIPWSRPELTDIIADPYLLCEDGTTLYATDILPINV